MLFGIPVLILISTHRQFPEFSPIDEGAHYDYVKRIYSHGIPIMGDVILPTSLNDIACYGVALDGLVLPPCDSDQVIPTNFPGAGLQYEAQQPPGYYLFAATISPIFQWIGLGALGAMRASGLLLFFATNVTIYSAARLLRIREWVLLPMIAVLNFAPVVAYHQSIVSNDVAILPLSSLIFYLVVRTISGKSTPTFVWLLLGIVAGLTKGTLLIACGIAFLFIVLWTLRVDKPIKLSQLRNEFTDNKPVRQLTILTASATITTGIWSVFLTTTTRIPLETLPPFDVLRQGSVSIQLIMREALVGFYPLTQSFAPYNGVSPDSMAVVNFIVNISMIASCAAGIFVATRVWWRVAGPIVLIIQYVGTLALGISIWRTYDMDPGLSSRYGLAAAPLIILILCAGIQRRFAQVVLSCSASAVALVYALNVLAST